MSDEEVKADRGADSASYVPDGEELNTTELDAPDTDLSAERLPAEEEPTPEEAEEEVKEEGAEEGEVEEEETKSGDTPDGIVDEMPEVGPEDIEAEIVELKEKRRLAEEKYERWNKAAKDARAAHFQGRDELPPRPDDEGETEERPPTQPRPAEGDFDTYDDYVEALTDWKVGEKLADYDRVAAEKADRGEVEDFTARIVQEGREKYGDFEAVAEDEIVPITPVIIEILRETDKPADIAYYLGKNLKEATQISRMNPVQATRAIGEIETKIIAEEANVEEVKTDKKSPTPKTKPTSAPPPIKPVKGGAETVTKDPGKMSNEEYRAWRMGR